MLNRDAVWCIVALGSFGCAGGPEPTGVPPVATTESTAASSAAHAQLVPASSSAPGASASVQVAPTPPSDGPMVKIARGSFNMGCPRAAATVCEDDEKPLHKVMLSPYEIDVYEITTVQYKACMDAGACMSVCPRQFRPELSKRPVVCVNAEDAAAYCKWRGKRLPTEAEWERAARGDLASPDGGKRIHPWGDQPPDGKRACVQTKAPCDVGTHPDGVSPYGLHDMAGNAAEWVLDYYDPKFYATSPARDPDGTWELLPIHRRGCPAATCDTARGGSFEDELTEVRSTARTAKATARGARFPSFGFRCARSTEPSRRAYFANRVNLWNAKRIQESTK